MYSFDLATGKILVPSQASIQKFSALFPSTYPVETAEPVGLGRSLRQSDNNNFAPRFGFSYQLGKDARTVLRGGWGVYYNHYSENVPGDLAAGPFSATTINTNVFTNGQPLFTLANPFAAAGHSRNALAARRGPQSAQQPGATIHAFARARTHARSRRARELHRLQRDRNWCIAAT